jgi:hypothetical protein
LVTFLYCHEVTKPTDCGLGSEPVEVGVTGFGMTVKESHVICKDLDPDAKGPTSKYAKGLLGHMAARLWKAKAATSPKSLGKALVSDPIVEAIRKELRRSTGQSVDAKDIRRLLAETVLRPECFDQRPGNSPL